MVCLFTYLSHTYLLIHCLPVFFYLFYNALFSWQFPYFCLSFQPTCVFNVYLSFPFSFICISLSTSLSSLFPPFFYFLSLPFLTLPFINPSSSIFPSFFLSFIPFYLFQLSIFIIFTSFLPTPFVSLPFSLISHASVSLRLPFPLLTSFPSIISLIPSPFYYRPLGLLVS